jgi:hypothetical protein
VEAAARRHHVRPGDLGGFKSVMGAYAEYALVAAGGLRRCPTG